VIFLGQLQDKLATIRTANSSASVTPLQAANVSLEHELNKSKSRWGSSGKKLNCEGADENDEVGGGDEMAERKMRAASANSVKKESATGVKKRHDAAKKDVLDFSTDAPMQSQIQMTIWKEDTNQLQTLRRKNDAAISDRFANFYKS